MNIIIYQYIRERVFICRVMYKSHPWANIKRAPSKRLECAQLAKSNRCWLFTFDVCNSGCGWYAFEDELLYLLYTKEEMLFQFDNQTVD